MHAGNIKSYIILANKLSKQEHIHFETIKKEIINLVTKLDQGPYAFKDPMPCHCYLMIR